MIDADQRSAAKKGDLKGIVNRGGTDINVATIRRRKFVPTLARLGGSVIDGLPILSTKASSTSTWSSGDSFLKNDTIHD
ncbi:MAG: hypothetical protein EON61_09625 [Alphaproteobacteria bacterium]|jgi:hypothetical protein|nr:MAG: hypothetical protein EON61_09625 [Alphaproteobacteria bacterium]